jgi:cation diffusion facilitator CzcD-associated flavoprotein CzcO
VVTEAEKVASEVKIFQLEPNWIRPKNSRDFTKLERRLNRLPPVYEWRRFMLYLDYDRRQFRSSHARSEGWFNKRRHEAAQQFLRDELGSRPDLLELVTPAFAFEGKRTVVSDTYYASLRSSKVTLVPHGVKGLTRTGATEAFLGMMVPGFSNFFIMYGPNTNASPLVHFYEAQASFAAALIARAAKTGRRSIDVRRSAFIIYNEWLQAQLAKTVWATTNNYFRAGTGRIVSQWPFGATAYILATKLLRRIGVRIS